jgi:hypothetical protein
MTMASTWIIPNLSVITMQMPRATAYIPLTEVTGRPSLPLSWRAPTITNAVSELPPVRHFPYATTSLLQDILLADKIDSHDISQNLFVIPACGDTRGRRELVAERDWRRS